MENADAMIRFGKYITVLKNLEPFKFIRTSENHAPNNRERKIWGIKHIIHNTNVFFRYTQTSPPVNNCL